MTLITLIARFERLRTEFMSQNLALLSQLLPEKIEFYHLGEVRLEQPRSNMALTGSDLDLRNRTAISFTLRGELQAAVVLLVRQGLDISMYSELGNIIASRLVTRLSDEREIDDVLSAPRVIAAEQLEFITLLSTSAICRTYVHLHPGSAGNETRLDLIIYTHATEMNRAGVSSESGLAGARPQSMLRSDA